MKSDAEDIRQFLTELSQQDWLGRLRSKWVNYLFHFSEIDNAVEILRSGRIRCRTDLEIDGALPVDIACSDIIENTDQEIKNSVRLYFRPLTPTQYHMEGFRPKTALSKNSHCRVPVFFLFDSRVVLCRDDSRFSGANLAIIGGKKNLGFTAAEFRNLNFKDIYSVGPIPSDGRSAVVSHRNAEVIIPKELDLKSLRFICCRSRAEKETLLHLLPPNLVADWGSRIYVSPDLYKRKWTFIESVVLDSGNAIFEFSPDTESSGPFEARVTVKSGLNKKVFSRQDFHGNKKISVIFGEELLKYNIEFLLDDHIAYAGCYDSTVGELPF